MVAVSGGQWVVIGIAGAVALAGFALMAVNFAAMLKPRSAEGGAGMRPIVGKPAQLTRRSFFGRAMFAGFGAAITSFAGISLGFLWPNLRGGFGGKVTLGPTASDVLAQIKSTKQPFYYGPGRFYLVPYDSESTTGGAYRDQGVTAGGLMALYQKCVHLGCRVPFCVTSQWFECPCHGSKYNRAGEYELGPAPRGLDRMPMTITPDGVITVDTGDVKTGPPRGTNTTGQTKEGPFCVEQREEEETHA